MSDLTVNEACAAYGATDVLRDVSLRVRAGTVHAVVGASGSGKTTLLRVIAGLHRLTGGSICLGEECWDHSGSLAQRRGYVPTHRRGVALVPQDGALFAHRTVAGNIAYGQRGPRSQRAQHLAHIVELCGLTDLARKKPSELSGGQQQRVALARALAAEPRVVLLDEPFSALDTQLRERLRREVADLLRRSGTTAVMVTHDMADVLAVADDVTLLGDGRVVQSSTVAELFERPASLGVALACGGRLSLRGDAEERLAHTPFGVVSLDRDIHGPCVVTPWVHQVTLVQCAAGAPTLQVVAVRYEGAKWRVTVAAACGERLEVLSANEVAVGDAVGVNVAGVCPGFTGV